MTQEDVGQIEKVVRRVVQEEIKNTKAVTLNVATQKAIDKMKTDFFNDMRIDILKNSALYLGDAALVKSTAEQVGNLTQTVEEIRKAVAEIRQGDRSEASLSQKVEVLWAEAERNGVAAKTPSGAQVGAKGEEPRVAAATVVSRIEDAANGAIERVKPKVQEAKSWLLKTKDKVKSYFSNHPFVTYLTALFAFGMPSVILVSAKSRMVQPGNRESLAGWNGAMAGATAFSSIGVIAASTWMFMKALDEWKVKSVSGGLEEGEVVDSKEIHPLRAQAAMKMGLSIVAGVAALARLIAVMSGFDLAVLVASIVAGSWMSVFSNSGNGTSALVPMAAARV